MAATRVVTCEIRYTLDLNMLSAFESYAICSIAPRQLGSPYAYAGSRFRVKEAARVERSQEQRLHSHRSTRSPVGLPSSAISGRCQAQRGTRVCVHSYRYTGRRLLPQGSGPWRCSRLHSDNRP